MKTHSSITNKQAVNENSLFHAQKFSSPESMMENLPFSCGWGWDISLSLEKEFEGAAGAILRWISFELWNSLDCTMGSCGEFSFKIPFSGTQYEFKGFQPVSICFFLWPQRRTLHSGPCQVLAAQFVLRYALLDSVSYGSWADVELLVMLN